MPKERKLILEEATVVLGRDGSLDSLELVIFTLNIEEKIKPIGVSSNILEIISQSATPPFSTIGEMATWLSQKG